MGLFQDVHELTCGRSPEQCLGHLESCMRLAVHKDRSLSQVPSYYLKRNQGHIWTQNSWYVRGRIELMRVLTLFSVYNWIKLIVTDWVSAVWAALGWKHRPYNQDVEPRHKHVTCWTERGASDMQDSDRGSVKGQHMINDQTLDRLGEVQEFEQRISPSSTWKTHESQVELSELVIVSRSAMNYRISIYVGS